MSLFKKVTLTLVVKCYSFIVNFFVSILLVRLLGASGKGELSLLTNFYTLVVSFSFLSFGSGFIYQFRRSQEKSSISTFLFFGLSLLMSLVTIGFLFSREIILVFLPQISSEQYYLSLLFIVIVIIAKINEGLTRAFYSAKGFNLVIIIEKTIYILGLISLIIFGHKELKLVIVILFISSIMSFLYTLYKFRNKISLNSPRLKSFKKILNFGLKEHLGVIAQKLNLRLDIVLMGMFLISDSQIGYYSIAVFFVELVWFIPNALGVFLFPKISGEKRTDLARKLTIRLTKYTFASSIPIVLFIFFVVPMLIPYLYGSEFIESINPLRVLIFGTFLMIPCKIISKYFAGTGIPQFNSYMAIIGLIINVFLLCVLVPEYGIMGAAISSAVSYSIMGFYMVIIFIHKTGNYLDIKKFFTFDNYDKMQFNNLYKGLFNL